MKYDSPKFYSISQLIIVLIILMVVASLFWNFSVISAKQKELEQLKTESHLASTSYEINLLISELRRKIDLFAQANSEQITDAVGDGELDAIYEDLTARMHRYFPHALAITIADHKGNVLIEDFDGYVQEQCTREISHFSIDPEETKLVVHPNPLGYHYDLMTYLKTGSHPLIVFISFKVSSIAEILKRDSLHGYQTILVNKNQPELIEITALGSRNALDGDHFIGDEMSSRLVGSIEIESSQWQLNLFIDEDNTSNAFVDSSVMQTVWAATAFVLIGLFAVFILQKFKMQMIRQNTMLKAQSEKIKESSDRLEAIFTSVLDGIVTIDADGIITDFNPAAENIFGYQLREVLGKNVNILMPEPYHSEHDQYLKNYFDTNVPKVIGIGREMTAKRKDGSIFPMDLSVTEVKHGVGTEFVGMVKDITERKLAESMKDEFVSTVSHELRTPLTSIRGSLGLIHGGKLGEIPDSIQQLLNIAITNTDRLVRLINDILDIEKIDSGKMNFELKSCAIIPVIEKAIEATKVMAHESSIDVSLDENRKDVVVNIDEDKIIQVMVNLISNAIKFSFSNTNVIISVKEESGNLRIDVTNKGRGIHAKDRSKIFQKFSQVDSSDTRDKGGSGLGLSICKSIVEKHNGTIGFTSDPGNDTTFFFRIPQVSRGQETEDDDELDLNVNRMLIIEDDKDVAHLLSLMLKNQNIKSDIASDAEQALQLLASRQYIGATLDIMLPGQDGIALLREIRENPRTEKLPVIVVSAKANETKKELNGDARYVLDWISKPIDQDRLYEMLTFLASQGDHESNRILHVEDDEEHAVLVQGMLSDEGEIINVGTLEESKQILAKEHFDLIILDLNLPDGKGMELCKYMERIGKTDIPVIVFSADELGDAAYSQVYDCLVKASSSNEDLTAAVRKAVGRD